MTIEVFAWCPTREMFVQGITSTPLPDGSMLATVDEQGNLIPAPDVLIDEIGPIMKTAPVYDEDGNEVTPAVMVEGHHVNLMATGQLADMLTAGLEQVDAEGNPKSLFERTHLLNLMPGMVWEPIPSEGIPPGYKGPNGVLLFDPAAVNSRSRVWL